MENGKTAVEALYRSLPADKVADYTPEHNVSNEFVIMMNKHGREVPVPTKRVQEALGRGYIHTSGNVVTEVPTSKRGERKKSEKVQLAEALQAVASAVKPAQEVDYSTMTFEELKAIGWNKLNAQGKARYNELKPQ